MRRLAIAAAGTLVPTFLALTPLNSARADEPGSAGSPDIDVLLSGNQTVAGETIAYPVDQPAAVTAAIVTLLPGQETGWHIHGVPVFGYILEGELTVDYGALGPRVYRQGEGFLEAISFRHNGRNDGEVPVRVLAVFMGGEASRNTIAEGPEHP